MVLPDSTTAVLPLERLTKLYDGLEQLEEMWSDGASEGDDDSHIEEDGDVEVWAMDDNGHWVENDAADAEDWESIDGEDDSMDVDEDGWSSSSPTVLQNDGIDATMAITDLIPGALPLNGGGSRHQEHLSTPTVRPSSPDVPKDAVEEDAGKVKSEEHPHWKRFEVLPSAPEDHAFFKSPPAQTSRHFLARLSREYRALESSLPGMIDHTMIIL